MPCEMNSELNISPFNLSVKEDKNSIKLPPTTDYYEIPKNTVKNHIVNIETKLDENNDLTVYLRTRLDDLDRNQDIKLDQDVFRFSQVYGASTTNFEIFKEIYQNGLNSDYAIFAYGPTGSGKTFSIFGNSDEYGIAYFVFLNLLEKHGSVSLTAHEVYNENVYDLLSGDKSIVRLRDVGTVVVIDGSSRVVISTKEMLVKYLNRINLNRSQDSSGINVNGNEHLTSSRSHCVLSATVISSNAMSRTIRIIDLAGSESMSSRRNCGEFHRSRKQVSEGCHINKSLLALSNCFDSFHRPSSFVPYRDSKLTLLLKPIFTNNRIFFIAHILSISIGDVKIARDTILFANKLKKLHIQRKSVKIPSLQSTIVSLRQEVEVLRGLLGVEHNESIFDVKNRMSLIGNSEREQDVDMRSLRDSKDICDETKTNIETSDETIGQEHIETSDEAIRQEHIETTIEKTIETSDETIGQEHIETSDEINEETIAKYTVNSNKFIIDDNALEVASSHDSNSTHIEETNEENTVLNRPIIIENQSSVLSFDFSMRYKSLSRYSSGATHPIGSPDSGDTIFSPRRELLSQTNVYIFRRAGTLLNLELFKVRRLLFGVFSFIFDF